MRGADFSELTAFAAVIRHGNFARAAAYLGVTPSALSQTIRKLEDRLNLHLLNRTTRSVSPTEVGRRLAERLLPVLDDLNHLVDDTAVSEGEVAGALRLNVPRIALASLAEIVPEFLARHPRVTMELVPDDSLVDIVRENYDAGIRLGERLQSDMIAIPFGGDLRMGVYGAPEYLKAHGTPTHPRDLARHACIGIPMPSDGSPYRWEFEKDGEALRISVHGPLVSGDSSLRLAGAIKGLGLTYIFDTEAAPHVETGQLLPVLEDWTPHFPGCFLYYPNRRNIAAPLRAFIETVQQWNRKSR